MSLDISTKTAFSTHFTESDLDINILEYVRFAEPKPFSSHYINIEVLKNIKKIFWFRRSFGLKLFIFLIFKIYFHVISLNFWYHIYLSKNIEFNFKVNQISSIRDKCWNNRRFVLYRPETYMTIEIYEFKV